MGLSTAAYWALGTSAALSVYSISQSGKKGPAPPPPTAMPTQNDDEVRAAKRKQIAEMQARSGRASTMLSDPGARLGG